jgi:hypothetical protein
MQKARSQSPRLANQTEDLLPLVGMWFQALFHSPHRGAFHLSLTVLVHYRSHGSRSPWRVVPPASRPISRVGRYSGSPLAVAPRRRATGLSPSLAPRSRGLPLTSPRPSVDPTTPGARRPPVWTADISDTSALPRSLAATWGLSVDSSSTGY